MLTTPFGVQSTFSVSSHVVNENPISAKEMETSRFIAIKDFKFAHY